MIKSLWKTLFCSISIVYYRKGCQKCLKTFISRKFYKWNILKRFWKAERVWKIRNCMNRKDLREKWRYFSPRAFVRCSNLLCPSKCAITVDHLTQMTRVLLAFTIWSYIMHVKKGVASKSVNYIERRQKHSCCASVLAGKSLSNLRVIALSHVSFTTLQSYFLDKLAE